MRERTGSHSGRRAVDIAHMLERELGAGRVILPGSDRLEDYGRDHSLLGTFVPEAAVLCQSSEEVAAVLRLAAEHRVFVTPRGAGSGKTGGCLPVRGGIVLSTERMDRIVEIDTGDLVAVVQPGVITGVLQAEVEARGLFYPPDPASLAYCSLGGNAAANAGGPRAFKYGVTRDYVLGLQVGLMGGELLRAGRRTAKGVSGYDIAGGFVGTEGTFGVITELTLRLLPRPPAVAALLALFADRESAGRAVGSLIGHGFRPRTLELVDRAAIEHVRAHSPHAFPTATGAAALLLIELDGDPDGLEPAIMRLGGLCERGGAVEVMVALDAEQRRRLWDARRAISPSLARAHPHKVSHDICVPRGRLTAMLARIDELAAAFDMPMASYGHAGDGNLHVNLLLDRDPADPAVAAHVQRIEAALFAHTIDLGGTLSGEHGIGLSKRRYMPLEHSARLLEWQRRWKRMWDPEELLNPGKVLPESALMSAPTCHE